MVTPGFPGVSPEARTRTGAGAFCTQAVLPFARSAVIFVPTAYVTMPAPARPSTTGSGPEASAPCTVASALGTGAVVVAVHTVQSRRLPPTLVAQTARFPMTEGPRMPPGA